MPSSPLTLTGGISIRTGKYGLFYSYISMQNEVLQGYRAAHTLGNDTQHDREKYRLHSQAPIPEQVYQNLPGQ